MKLMNHVRAHALLYAIVLLAALARLLYLFDVNELWWDTGVYAGMAKFLWSGGSAGLWEHIRPALWPALLGIGWWLKLNIVLFARMLELGAALLSTALVYALARKWFSQRAAVSAGVLWAFSAMMFYVSLHEYTELPAVTLALAALLALAHNRMAFAGFLAGLAFLMKFPAGIFIVVLGLYLVLRREWKSLFRLGAGFAIPVAVLLAFNQWMYGAPVAALRDAQSAIVNVLGCNVLRFKPWYQYFGWIAFDNVFNVLALLGIGAALLRWKKQYVLPALALAVPLLYFLPMHCREYRYLLLFLPFVNIFAGHGIALVVARLERRKPLGKYAWNAVLLVVLAVSLATCLLFYANNEPRVPDLAAQQYFEWLGSHDTDGEIWSSNPVVSVYTDKPVQKIYYPVFAEGAATDFNSYLREHRQAIGAVLLDNCGGGIICPPEDAACAAQLNQTRSFLNENFRQVLFTQSGNCWYAVYAP